MADKTPEQKQKGPFQQVKPRWIAENLAALGGGYFLGHVAGGAAMKGVSKIPGVADRVRAMSPAARKRLGMAIQGGTGVVGGFALNQARNAMSERLRRKRLEAERAEKKASASPLLLAARLRIEERWDE